jgi:anaerobic magnesium-protoporphyrin IX monomethyl ester cyclase
VKVVLIFPCLEKDMRFHHIPLSLLSLAAPLVARGIECEIFDERVDPFDELGGRLSNADIVGITMFTGYQTSRAYEILKYLQRLPVKPIVVAGGPHVTNLPNQVLSSGLVDYVIVGYGEESFCRLVECFATDAKEVLALIPGVGSVLEDGSHQLNASKNTIASAYWSALPYEKIDIKKYINPATDMVMYVTMYGCPGKCAFCATPSTLRCMQKPVELVIEDLVKLHEAWPYRLLVFNDATFFVNKKRLFSILHGISRYTDLEWCAFARADEIIKYSRAELEAVKQAGGKLINLGIGLESGSHRVAEEIMRKGKGHLEKFKECIRKLVEVDVPVTSGLIFGMPGETAEDVGQTINYLTEIRLIYPEFRLSTTFFRPLPGTGLYHDLDAAGFALPATLQEWAEQAGSTHYRYNEWMQIPWMSDQENDEYRKAYERFIEVHGDLIGHLDKV